jgi:hypothetical protein
LPNSFRMGKFFSSLDFCLELNLLSKNNFFKNNFFQNNFLKNNFFNFKNFRKNCPKFLLSQPNSYLKKRPGCFECSTLSSAFTDYSEFTKLDRLSLLFQILRKLGVVNKFVEFFGSGCQGLSIADRATISNMAPEYGATCGFFPVDAKTLDYLLQTGTKKKFLQLR